MAIIEKAIRLETTKQNLVQAVIAKQGDSNSRYLKVTFLDEGSVIPLDSSSQVTINAEREDGTSQSFFGVVNGDDTATVPLHSWILELDGVVNCDISIIGADSRLTTTTFVVKVEKAACSSGDISTDPQYDVLANLINDVNAAKNGTANAIVGTASGTLVAMKDVSPLEHPIGVKLSAKKEMKLLCVSTDIDDFNFLSGEGEYIVTSVDTTYHPFSQISFLDGSYIGYTDSAGLSTTLGEGDALYWDESNMQLFLLGKDGHTTAFSSVTLKKYGKNLIDLPQIVNVTDTKYAPLVDNGDGTFTLTKVGSRWQTKTAPVYVPKNTPFTISAKVISQSKQFSVGIVRTDDWWGRVPNKTLTEPYDLVGVFLYFQQGDTDGTYCTFADFQIEIGTATEYEPYKEPENYTPKADGTVGGIIGKGEGITLMTDTEGVTITAEYNVDTKKYIDKKFAEIAALIVNS